MPTSPRQNAPVFTEIFGEFAGSQWVDVGIDPYAFVEKIAQELDRNAETPARNCGLAFVCSAVFQYRKKIEKIFDDVVAPFVGVFARSVEACGNPGVAAALHVGRQTVSDHESTFAAAFSDLRENLVVKILLGLFGAAASATWASVRPSAVPS